jgi:hypothetical protein
VNVCLMCTGTATSASISPIVHWLPNNEHNAKCTQLHCKPIVLGGMGDAAFAGFSLLAELIDETCQYEDVAG